MQSRDVNVFLGAVHHGDQARAKDIIAKHFSKPGDLDRVHPLFMDKIVRPLLFYAVSVNQPWLADWLLVQGANVNVRCKLTNSTPLMCAVTYDATEMAKLLLDWGAEIHDASEDGSTAFLMCKSLGMGKLLLRYGANIHDRDENNQTNLYKVVKYCREEMNPEVFARYVSTMFTYGADPFFKVWSNNGETVYDQLLASQDHLLLAVYRQS